MTVADLQYKENAAVSAAVEQRLKEGSEGVPIAVDAEELSILAEKCHNNLINSLIASYVHYVAPSLDIADAMLAGFGCRVFELIPLDADTAKTIPSLCDQLHADFINSEFKLDKGFVKRVSSRTNFIERGAVYTRSDIAQKIVETTVDNWFSRHSEKLPVVLDFACGTGRFYEQVIVALSRRRIDVVLSILENLYAVDIDSVAVNITRLKALSYLQDISIETLGVISRHIVQRDALVQNNLFGGYDEEPLNERDLDGYINQGFDIVVSNPPYLVLKPNRKKHCAKGLERIARQNAYFRSCGRYSLSIEGMLNLYKISIEAMLGMVKAGGELGIICPSTLFADASATKLRKHLIQFNCLRGIVYFAESLSVFDKVRQATAIFYLQKGGATSDIGITDGNKTYSVPVKLVYSLFPEHLEIPFISEVEWGVLAKLSRFGKLKDIPYIRNKRGELDLTFCREYITADRTPLRLVRGNMIADNGLKDVNGEYVLASFLERKTQDFINNDYGKRRIICQQVCNSGLYRRLRFVYCEETDILGNSCNYISSRPEILAKLMILLNSSILNWRFKVTSSNNHISNYELGELPLADLEKVDESRRFSSQKELDYYVGSLYGLTRAEIDMISRL